MSTLTGAYEPSESSTMREAIIRQSACNHLDGRIRALRVEHDELGAIDVDVLEGEALGRHLMREAISMPSACHQHAISM